MYKKISNTADRVWIEREMQASFEYPKLYQPQILIDGAKESSIPVVISEKKDTISFGIWGLLPEDYIGDWSDFQNNANTLEVSKEELTKNPFFKDPFQNRRCLIAATGFFLNLIQDGLAHPYYVHFPSQKPFCFGGIYNILSDGFITFSIVKVEAKGFFKDLQYPKPEMPLVVPNKFHDMWLDTTSDSNDLSEIFQGNYHLSCNAYPISKDLFDSTDQELSALKPLKNRNLPVFQH